MPVRLPVIVLVLVAGLTCGVVAVGALSATPRRPSAPGPSESAHRPEAAGARFAVDVLHAWDARRAAAWAEGDPQALARLYTRRSAAGAADVSLLRRYVARGLVVRELRMQVLRARVLVVQPRRIELEVTDRLAGATAVRADAGSVGRVLPSDGPTTRRLVLRRDGAGWVMARVATLASSGRR